MIKSFLVFCILIVSLFLVSCLVEESVDGSESGALVGEAHKTKSGKIIGKSCQGDDDCNSNQYCNFFFHEDPEWGKCDFGEVQITNSGLGAELIAEYDFEKGKKISFKGKTNSYYILPAKDLNKLNDFTIMFWAKTSSQKTSALISAANINEDNELTIMTDLTVYLNANKAKLSKNIKLTDNKWHHLSLTRKGSKVKLYFDGRFSGYLSGLGDEELEVNLAVLGQELDLNVIGQPFFKVVDGEAFTIDEKQSYQGNIDKLKIYGYALQSTEIKEIATKESLEFLFG